MPLIATVGLGVGDFVCRISHYFVFRWFQAWVGNMVRNTMVSCMGGMVFRPHGHGKRQCTTRSAYILPLPRQLFFSRFISFRVIASFFFARPPLANHWEIQIRWHENGYGPSRPMDHGYDGDLSEALRSQDDGTSVSTHTLSKHSLNATPSRQTSFES